MIPGLIGWGRTRELLYFGEPINAGQAHAWGFVNAVVTESDLEEVVAEWTRRFEMNGSGAMRLQKKLMRVREANLLIWLFCCVREGLMYV